MARLQHFARAIPPSFRVLYEPQCRTKTSLLILREGHVRPKHAATGPYSRLSPSLGFRSISTSRATYSTTAQPRQTPPNDIVFSADQPADLPDRVSKLFPAWQLTESKKGITRQFTFTSFGRAWSFMKLVAKECKAHKHHPSWSNSYNQVTIEWTTHKPEGLSIKDVEMAEICENVAQSVGQK